MKVENLSYEVTARVTFTGREIWLLGRAARSHYDGRCRLLCSRGETLWFLAQRWGIANGVKDGSKVLLDGGELGDKGNPPENADRSCHPLCMSYHEFDLLCKVCEQWVHAGVDQNALLALHSEFKLILRRINEEYEAVQANAEVRQKA